MSLDHFPGNHNVSLVFTAIETQKRLDFRLLTLTHSGGQLHVVGANLARGGYGRVRGDFSDVGIVELVVNRNQEETHRGSGERKYS